MLPAKDTDQVLNINESMTDSPIQETSDDTSSFHGLKRFRTEYLSRETYQGSLIFNLATFALPALYSTISKLWIANIDPSQVLTSDTYTYISVIAQVLNDGLPRSAWLIIGDKTTRTVSSRLGLSYTLVLVQTVLGAIMTVVFIAASHQLAAAFVPSEFRETSIKYVQISSVMALSSAMQVAVTDCTRALDNPDVPLLINSTSFIINIVLDLLIISKFHVGSWKPTINDQALIKTGLRYEFRSCWSCLLYVPCTQDA